MRVHGATRLRPVDMFEEERAHLKRLSPVGFDLARVRTVSVNKQFRVALDSNAYSVPSCRCCQPLLQGPAAPQVFDNALPTPGLQARRCASRRETPARGVRAARGRGAAGHGGDAACQSL